MCCNFDHHSGKLYFRTYVDHIGYNLIQATKPDSEIKNTKTELRKKVSLYTEQAENL
jgi:hypothetical protein